MSISYIYCSLSLLWPSASCTALCPLYSLLTPLQPCKPSTALQPLYGFLLFYHLYPSVALYTLYGPLSCLWFSVSSMAIWPLYGHVIFSLFHEMMLFAVSRDPEVYILILPGFGLISQRAILPNTETSEKTSLQKQQNASFAINLARCFAKPFSKKTQKTTIGLMTGHCHI